MGSTIDVLGACEMVVEKVVELAMEELTFDKLGTVGIGSVEHTAGTAKEWKAAPLQRGRGRVGFAAVPRVLPSPGKILAGTATLVLAAAGAATIVWAAAGTAVAFLGLSAKAADLAAWLAAALSLFLTSRPGPRRLAPS